MPRTERRIRIEQRPSDQVHGKSYSNGKAQRVPCRYCGRPTVEDPAYSAYAKSYLGCCHRCRTLLAGQPENLADEFEHSGRKPTVPAHTRLATEEADI